MIKKSAVSMVSQIDASESTSQGKFCCQTFLYCYGAFAALIHIEGKTVVVLILSFEFSGALSKF